MIAPFWADVDTRVGNPIYVNFNVTDHVLTVNWNGVGYYSQHTNPTNSFQLQLVDRNGGNFDAKFVYNSIGWTTGDASGGSGGLGGTPARAGFTYGNGDASHEFELPQSGHQAALLSLPATPGNTGANGIWNFSFVNGVPTNVLVNYSVANASSTYGALPTVGAVTLTGSLNGQPVTATVGVFSGSTQVTLAPNTPVGNYTERVIALSNPNYTIASLGNVDGILTINPATLTYAANPVSRAYGGANPTLSGTVNGFVAGDTLASATSGALNFTTSAAPKSNVGSYAVTGSGLTANNGNYVFAQAPANATALTINPASITVTAQSGTSTYGGSPANPGLTATGLQNGEGLDVLTGLSGIAPVDVEIGGAALLALSL
jgi:hypothetical protein